MRISLRKELPELLKHFNLPLIGVEVGVECGYQSCDLLKNGLEKIYCVDSWEANDYADQETHDKYYAETFRILSQFDRERYVILKGQSSVMHREIPDGSCGLVYIDGDHSYSGVVADIENYKSKLVEGGIMGFHDYVNIPSVMKAVNDFADLNSLDVIIIPESNRGDAGCYMRI